jgi:hypothetical protein
MSEHLERACELHRELHHKAAKTVAQVSELRRLEREQREREQAQAERAEPFGGSLTRG